MKDKIKAIYRPKNFDKIPSNLERFIGKPFEFVHVFTLGGGTRKAYECLDINWPSYVVFDTDLEIIEDDNELSTGKDIP